MNRTSSPGNFSRSFAGCGISPVSSERRDLLLECLADVAAARRAPLGARAAPPTRATPGSSGPPGGMRPRGRRPRRPARTGRPARPGRRRSRRSSSPTDVSGAYLPPMPDDPGRPARSGWSCPTYNERDNLEPIVAAVRAAARRGRPRPRRCWSSTTPRRTAPGSSPTGSRPTRSARARPAPARASRASARPTSRASATALAGGAELVVRDGRRLLARPRLPAAR